MTGFVNGEAFRAAMRRTASGVAVITTNGPHGPAGLTVSTLQSLSLDPPSVVMCVNVGSKSLAPLLANARFTANILATDQVDVAMAFADAHAPSDRRFTIGLWRETATGSLMLDGALCNVDCRVGAVFEFGSHKIVVGEVVELRAANAGPLIYANRGYRALT